VAHLAGELNLLLEAIELLLRRGARRSNGLQRDVRVQLSVFDLVDFTHAAAGDEADDAVAIADDIVGREDRRSGFRLGSRMGGVVVIRGARAEEKVVFLELVWVHSQPRSPNSAKQRNVSASLRPEI
jgi:hypothetical protein